MNYADPNLMTTVERHKEVAEILSSGIARLQERKRKIEKISLDKSPTIRPYGHKSTLGEKHE
jgi:hypothetical protein